MALTVCVGSFYLTFLMMIVMKDTLVFYAIRKGQSTGNYDHILMLMVIFDLIILFTLPLAMAGTRGIC